MDQSANKLALVEPSNFNFNTETFDTNVFQNDVQFNKLKIFEEFDNFISTLDKNKISFNILKSPKNSPDSIYPNNWVVTFEDGTYDLFSMQSPNRRIERSNSNINFLNTKYSLKNDLTEYEAKNIFLEGTGSLVLDRVNKIAYMAIYAILLTLSKTKEPVPSKKIFFASYSVKSFLSEYFVFKKFMFEFDLSIRLLGDCMLNKS